MAKLTFKRCEKKFLLSLGQYEMLKSEILKNGMVYDKYCKGGVVYKIYNIYFDDDENSVIRKSISHPKFKEKFRMRSYFIPKSGEDTVFLEIKRKIKGTVVKRRATLTYKEALDFIENGTRPDTDDYLENKVLDELEYYMSIHNVRPKVFISYERMAFFGGDDPDFRVTFDRNITTRRTDLRLDMGVYGDKLLADDEVLMEVKIPGSIPIWFSDLLARHEIYISGFSKYGNEYSKFKGHDFLHYSSRRDKPLSNTSLLNEKHDLQKEQSNA